MKKVILALILLSSCKQNTVERAVWINESPELYLAKDSLVFEAEGAGWEASLQSFTQPIPLKINYTKSGFVLSAKNNLGFTEGQAVLSLYKKGHYFFYPFMIKNHFKGNLEDKDYRSPKTVNPDSSMAQHRMRHTIDSWRNIVSLNTQKSVFEEDIISLSPKVGVFRAQEAEPLSAFYVQAGSATDIPLRAEYNPTDHEFQLKVGLLKDKYGNMVANGTLVTFVVDDGKQTTTIETALMNGFAMALVPIKDEKKRWVKARIAELSSQVLTLTPY